MATSSPAAGPPGVRLARPLYGAVDGGARDGEQLGELGAGVLPARQSSTGCASCAGLSLGCLPRKRPLALAIFMTSLVLFLYRTCSLPV